MYKIVMLILLPLVLFAQYEHWVFRYDGDGSEDDDIAESIVYGSDGNVYVAGQSTGIGTNGDFTVMSLTTAGDTNWIYRYNGPGDYNDKAYSVTYGDDGNIYAAGDSFDGFSFWDLMVISLTTAGDTNWTYRYDGPGNESDQARSIVYGSDGNIYAAGNSNGGVTEADAIVISLTTAGDTNWVYRYNGPSNWGDQAYSVVYGADGNVYAVGTSAGIDSTSDFLVISLATTGDTNWVYRYDGSAHFHDVAYSVVYGLDHNIYAAGYSVHAATEEDFTVVSLDTSGLENWVYLYDAPGSTGIYNIDNAYSITYGDDGNIYAGGYSTGDGTYGDFTVMSLTTVGDTNWIYRYNGSANFSDMVSSITYGDNGNIYAAGHSAEIGTEADFTIISLTTAGDTNWTYRYDGPGNSYDQAYSVAYGSDNNIYAAGYSSDTDADFTVISLGTMGIKENTNLSHPTFCLSQNTPNPFIGVQGTFIRYSISTKSDVNLTIYNSLGQRVKTLIDCIQDRGTYRVVWKGESDSGAMLPNGLYFCRIIANPLDDSGEFSDIKKLLFLK